MALRQGLAGSLVPGQVSKVLSGAVAVVAVYALAACGVTTLWSVNSGIVEYLMLPS